MFTRRGFGVHSPSQSNKRIGLIGLVWFIYCTVSAAGVVLDPEGFRSWSHFTWTDRELLIGAGCYFTAGLAGLVLAVTRLLLPLFARTPMIGYDVAAPLMAVDVEPRFEDFHVLSKAMAARGAKKKILFTMLFGVVFFIMLEHPLLRRRGIPFHVAAYGVGCLLIVRALFVLVRSLFARTRWWSTVRWMRSQRCHSPRRYHVFDDGILVQGMDYHKVVPWYDVRQAHLFGNTLGMVGRNEMILIPGAALPSEAHVDLLMQLLERKRVSVTAA
jgi:hypothetical protein